MDEKISIVIPVYNVEKYLNRCMISICGQTYSNLEIIVVNDGSTDASLDICTKWRERDNRVIVINKKNGGLSDARNAGIEIATGEYIVFVDSDDFIDVRSIEFLYQNALRFKADISIASFLKVSDLLDTPPEVNLSQKVSVYNRDEAMHALFDDSTKMDFTVAWGKLYKKQIFDSIRYPVGRKYEDSSIAHLVYNCVERVAYSRTPLYFYSYRIGSITTNTVCRDVDAVTASQDRMKFFETWGDDELKYKSVMQLITCAMGIYARYDSTLNNSASVKHDLFNLIEQSYKKIRTEAKTRTFIFDIRTFIFLKCPGLYSSVIQLINSYRRKKMRASIKT